MSDRPEYASWRAFFTAIGVEIPEGADADAMPCRQIFFHSVQDMRGVDVKPDDERIRTHSCPKALVDGVIEYVRRTQNGAEPYEILPAPAIDLDPGGSVVDADSVRTFGAIYPLKIYTCHVPAMIDFFMTYRDRPVLRRTYGGVPCVRWPEQGHRLSLLPEADVPAILHALKGFLPEAIGVIAGWESAVRRAPQSIYVDMSRFRPEGEA